MRTADHTFDPIIPGTAFAASRWTGLTSVMTSVWRRLRDRGDIARLCDLDDQRLLDIGLCRSDVREALALSLFQDAGPQLAHAARRRALAFYRDAPRN